MIAAAPIPVAAGGPLSPLVDAAFLILDFFHDQLGFGWGLGIVGMTVVVRLLILPLSIKQIRSMRALQALQPELKALQERYGDDRQRMQQEMIRFYQENNVNPLASCLPLLLQLPVFIALFIALRSDEFRDRVEESGTAGWLFIEALDEPAAGGALAALVLLYVVTQLFASLVMITATVDRTQRIIVLALPFVFIPFIIQFPAGLVVYWITTNTWTIGQQFVVKRLAPPPDVQKRLEVREEVKRAPPPPPRKKRKKRSGKRR